MYFGYKFKMRHSALLISILTSILLNASHASDLFPLSIIHINDFHARFEATDIRGGTCNAGEECIGGYARTVYTVRRLLEEQKDYNPVYINAGDSFQGTLWYNIGRWNVTSQFLNILPADVMTLGNHEFDHGVEGVVPFLETLNTTMLVANMDSSHESTLQGKYNKSTIIERSGRKIGIIGVILETTDDLANTGKLIFRNESHAILEEAQLLQNAGANIIIIVSHCGYEVDKIIARTVGDVIDVIVGAHSHTFLFTGDVLPGPERPGGDYPTQVIHQPTGHRVLIVQASAYARYVGNITVFFDENGNVVDYDGAPIYMSSDVPEDPAVLAALPAWKEIIDERGSIVLGENKVELSKTECNSGECNLGNFFCDAMVHSVVGLSSFDQFAWSDVSIGLTNVGSLRVPLSKGNLTYNHVVTMSPFENLLHSVTLTGDKIIEALEMGVSYIDLANNQTDSYINLQVSGLKITYDYRKPVGSRVVAIKARCANCEIPKYETLDVKKSYRVVMPSFLQTGGDGFKMFLDHGKDVRVGMSDIDALESYIGNSSPIYTGQEGRITVVN